MALPASARRAERRSPPRWATLESVAGWGATADRWQTRDARARSTRRRRRARPCGRGSRPPVHGQDGKASSPTERLRDTSFAAHLQQALSDSGERRDEGVLLTADYAGIRCLLGRSWPLNPFAACRDQRTNGRKGPNGIKRGKPQHSAGGFNPRNENGCDRRVRPHPPPRRSGGPPGCLHPGGPAIFIEEFPLFGSRPTRRPTSRFQGRWPRLQKADW